MHLAAIDIGTNSLHMILARVAADGAFEVIGREQDMVRLGAGGLEGRPLGEGAMTTARANGSTSPPSCTTPASTSATNGITAIRTTW